MRPIFTLSLAVALSLAAAVLVGPGSRPALATPADQVSAGALHSCALTAAGGALCWGDNGDGQLGDGTTNDSLVPVAVVGLGSGLAAIEAGPWHTCALADSGSVKCWGRNDSGQLGDGTTDGSALPVDVAALGTGVAAVAIGWFHTCVLTTAGGVKCWGYNRFGNLGDGTRKTRAVPVDVVGLTVGVAGITAGRDHTCAVTVAGGAECWGENSSGQVGDGERHYRTAPVDVIGLTSGVAAIAAGEEHTCALTTGGGVQCWGFNIFGQLGDGQDGAGASSGWPVDVVGLSSGVAAVTAGGIHTCALTTAGGVKCWGWNIWSQIGVPSTGFSDYYPTPQDAFSGATSLSAGSFHNCAINDDSAVVCWGYNAKGQLGDGTTTESAAPVGLLIDSDSDRCADDRELQTAVGSETTGGLRDPKLFWDFFDTPTGTNLERDQIVGGGDIAALVARFGANDSGAGDFDRNSDPLSTPNPAVIPAGDRQNYHPAFDRSATPPGGEPWDSQAADGVISGTDIAAMVAQFSHTCL